MSGFAPAGYAREVGRRVLRSRKLARDGGTLGLSSLAAVLLQTGLQIVIVRQSSLAAFGALTAAMVYAGTVEMIVSSRSGELALQIVGKHIVHGDGVGARAAAVWLERHDRIVFGAVWLAVALAAPAVAPLLGLNPWYLVGLALSLPAQAGYGVSKSIFISTGRIQQQAVFEVGYWTVACVFGIVGVVTAGIGGLIASQVLANVAKTLLARRMTSRLVSRHLDASAAEAYAGVGKAVGPLGLHSLLRNGMNFFAGQLDVVVLNAALGNEATAVYKIAKSLATIPVRVTAPVWSALRPRLLDAWHAARRRRVLELVSLPAAGMLVGTVLAAGPAVYLAPRVIGTVYGAAYAAAAEPFLLLVWGTLLFQSITGWFGFWVVIAEQRSAGTLVYAAYLALLALGAMLIGRRSATEMALSVALASALASALGWALFLTRTRALLPQSPATVSKPLIA